ncbi:MAG: hypothetical protein Q4G62_01140 [Pseudomonadota bacterium]|nr:hypothetical protein [Pseudomonadota bacterium]
MLTREEGKLPHRCKVQLMDAGRQFMACEQFSLDGDLLQIWRAKPDIGFGIGHARQQVAAGKQLGIDLAAVTHAASFKLQYAIRA